MLLGFHDPLDMVLVQFMTLVNDCDGMTLVVGLPLTDKSKGSSWNAPSLLMDLLSGNDQWNPLSDQCTDHQQSNQHTNGLEK
jgi:hypothetical protein